MTRINAFAKLRDMKAGDLQIQTPVSNRTLSGSALSLEKGIEMSSKIKIALTLQFLNGL